MSAKHAALPWQLIGKQGTAIWSSDKIVASIDGARDSHTAARATAEFIVRACNAHVELVTALDDLVYRIERWEVAVRAIIRTEPNHGMDLTKARAALAATKEAK